MKLYSIIPLLEENAAEVVEDVIRQYEEGIATEALFKMTLTPEGTPVLNKAQILAKKYEKFRDMLQKRGHGCGILVQASIGHGRALPGGMPFPPVIGLLNGAVQNVACPYSDEFRTYIKDAMRTLAKTRPTTLMVDDDFRLFGRGIRGCACPLHMREINRRAGLSLTREEMLALFEQDTPESRRVMRIFYETQEDALIGAARAMREGIDEVDPTLQGAFCLCCDTCEGVAEIARILAGEGNPVIVRVNNAKYCAPGARGITSPVARAATQMAALRGKVDIFLAETDTCPQNRYSTSASSLHSHFVASILEGADGAKHWITRLSAHEPKSGEAYRRILAANAGFYKTLSATVKGVKWFGAKLPLPSEPQIPTPPLSQFHFASEPKFFASRVLERMGIPFYFETGTHGTLFLDSTRDRLFSDEEISQMLHGTLFLAAESALSLQERGFGRYLGVCVRERTAEDPIPNGERILVSDRTCALQQKLKHLTPTSPKTVAHSMHYILADGVTKTPLYPGVTGYQNEFGGTVYVFAGSPEAPFTYHQAFSFLCESRKAQLLALLQEKQPLPLYYTEDAEVYVKAGTCPDGSLLCAFFNIGLDHIEQIPLHLSAPVHSVETLCPDGSFTPCNFTARGSEITVHTPAPILMPVVLRLK